MNSKLSFWRLFTAVKIFMAILAIPTTVSAQYRAQDPRVAQIQAAIAGYNRSVYRPYGYPSIYGSYDPYRDNRGRDIYGRELPPIEVQECYFKECYPLKGTFHYEKGELHFRAFDSTHHPFNENHKDCLVIHSQELVGIPSTQVGQATLQAPQPLPQQSPSLAQGHVLEYQRAYVGNPYQDCRRDGKLRIQNNSGIAIDIKVDGQPVVRLPLQNGQNWWCAEPGHQYEASANVFYKGEIYGTAGTQETPMDRKIQGDTLTFNMPAFKNVQ